MPIFERVVFWSIGWKQMNFYSLEASDERLNWNFDQQNGWFDCSYCCRPRRRIGIDSICISGRMPRRWQRQRRSRCVSPRVTCTVLPVVSCSLIPSVCVPSTGRICPKKPTRISTPTFYRTYDDNKRFVSTRNQNQETKHQSSSCQNIGFPHTPSNYLYDFRLDLT